MALCSLKSPVLQLLNFDIQSILDSTNIKDDINKLASENNTIIDIDVDDDMVKLHAKTIKEEKKTKHEIQLVRQISQEIHENCIRQTRLELLNSIILTNYPSLNIPNDIIHLIFDFESNDPLNEIFNIFNNSKTISISSVYIIPYIIGWIQMLSFVFLSSEYWRTHNNNTQLTLLVFKLIGWILGIATLIQLCGCILSLKLNISQTYILKLNYIKQSFNSNNFHHYYDSLYHMILRLNDCDPWELYIPFFKWCNALRIQNIYNIRNIQCKPIYIILFYLIKPIFSIILSIQLITLSPHCVFLWIIFCLYLTTLISICVFNKSPIGSIITCILLIIIITLTSISYYPSTFQDALIVSCEIFLFVIFLLYIFSLYLMCCGGARRSNQSSGIMLPIWLLLFICYCLWVSEVLYTENKINIMLCVSVYIIYISFQMLLLTANDVSIFAGIHCCSGKLKFMFISLLFGWLIDLDSLSYLFCNKSTFVLSDNPSNLYHDDDEDSVSDLY